mmetsp:Transcript_13319/g.13138  ORF Transcript_13319/g.13138 Transcript_13319/m.13138 type:complete len:109 (-) Transcript_13319:2585-2911(-)
MDELKEPLLDVLIDPKLTDPTKDDDMTGGEMAGGVANNANNFPVLVPTKDSLIQIDESKEPLRNVSIDLKLTPDLTDDEDMTGCDMVGGVVNKDKPALAPKSGSDSNK